MIGGGTLAEDFSTLEIKLFGVIEIVVSILLVVPELFGQGYMLTSIAAFLASIIMAFSLGVKLRRKEYSSTPAPFILMLVALFTCYMTYPS